MTSVHLMDETAPPEGGMAPAMRCRCIRALRKPQASRSCSVSGARINSVPESCPWPRGTRRVRAGLGRGRSVSVL